MADPGRRGQSEVKVGEAKGRPMLSWVGKRPLRHVAALPAQEVERFAIDGAVADVDWTDWPASYPLSGLLFHGDNKEVLGHLLGNGFRGKVDLVYIDPPFDSGANYVRKVQLRGATGSAWVAGDGYTLGEQIQYADIWANDTYLQFMFERLLLLKELLAANSSIVLHTDYHKTHVLRCLMDEVFGGGAFANEIVWHYPDNFQGNVKGFASNHDLLLWYGLGDYYWHKPMRELEKRVRRPTRVWDKETGSLKLDRDEHGRPLYRDYTDASLDDVIEIPQRSVVVPGNADYTGYPTAKPPSLLSLLIDSLTPPGGLVLDAFAGSGTAPLAAQRLGRRWIAVDINLGAIQTATRRLVDEMGSQTDRNLTSAPAQLSFTTYRVNDYDLAIQHNEAVELACQALGIERVRTDTFFDGTLGRQLVRILPFDHPASPLDIEDVIQELRNRPNESRDIVLVALGKELACDPLLTDHNRRGAPNRISVVELRTDPKTGGFFAHEPASADVHLEHTADRVRVVIDDFLSPTIVERLAQQQGVVSPQITDWRAMVDSVMIDPANDGDVFNVVCADVPEHKSDLVEGRYEFSVGDVGAAIAVKITDMLGEVVVVRLSATNPDAD